MCGLRGKHFFNFYRCIAFAFALYFCSTNAHAIGLKNIFDLYPHMGCEVVVGGEVILAERIWRTVRAVSTEKGDWARMIIGEVAQLDLKGREKAGFLMQLFNRIAFATIHDEMPWKYSKTYKSDGSTYLYSKTTMYIVVITVDGRVFRPSSNQSLFELTELLADPNGFLPLEGALEITGPWDKDVVRYPIDSPLLKNQVSPEPILH